MTGAQGHGGKMNGKRILLIVGGGIAAMKVPQLIRLIRAEGAAVTPVLTKAGAQFTTPMTLSVLAGEAAHDSLWNIAAEAEIGHIQLSRNADLVVWCPPPPTCWPRWRMGWRTTSPPRCCWRRTSECWSRPR